MICENGVCSIANQKTLINEPSQEVQEHKVIELTDDNFVAIVQDNSRSVVIDFYATWCRPCHDMKPIFAELAQEEAEWIFAAIDVDTMPSMAARYRVEALPTFMVFKHGQSLGMIQGVRSKEELRRSMQSMVETGTPVVAHENNAQQLILAISQQDSNEVKRIIAQGIDINAAVSLLQGTMFPLEAAIFTGGDDIISVLLDSGARMSTDVKEAVKSRIESSEKLYALVQECFEYAVYKIRAMPSLTLSRDYTHIPDAYQRLLMGMQDTTQLANLIADGVDVNMLFTFGVGKATPLYLAVLLHNKDAVTMLIEAGASLQTKIIDKNGCAMTVESALRNEMASFDEYIKRGYDGLERC